MYLRETGSEATEEGTTLLALLLIVRLLLLLGMGILETLASSLGVSSKKSSSYSYSSSSAWSGGICKEGNVLQEFYLKRLSESRRARYLDLKQHPRKYSVQRLSKRWA